MVQTLERLTPMEITSPLVDKVFAWRPLLEDAKERL
jgi:hypothetical protein